MRTFRGVMRLLRERFLLEEYLGHRDINIKWIR